MGKLDMGRSICGYYPIRTTIVNAPVLQTDSSGNTVGNYLPAHDLVIGAGGTSLTSIDGPAGYILTSNGPDVDPSYKDPTTVNVAEATVAVNVKNGSAGQLVYQSASNTTSFAGPGTAGHLLQSNGAAAPTYTATPSIKTAVLTNTSLPSANALNITHSGASEALSITATGAQAFVARSTGINVTAKIEATGNTNNQLHFLRNSGTKNSYIGQNSNDTFSIEDEDQINILAPVINVGQPDANYLSTNSLGDVVFNTGTANATFVSTDATGAFVFNTGPVQSSSNIDAGTTGQLVYQSAPDTTGFVGPGIAGHILQSNGASAPTYTSTPSLKTAILTNTTTPSANALNITHSGASEALSITATGAQAFVARSTGINITAKIEATGNTNNQLHFLRNSGTKNSYIGQNSNDTFSIEDEDQINILAPVINVGQPDATYISTNSLGDLVFNAGSVPSSGNLSGGTAGQLVYQSAPNTTDFAGPGTAGDLLQSNGTSTPTYTNTPAVKTLSLTNTSSPATTAATISHAGTGEAMTISTTSTGSPLKLTSTVPNTYMLHLDMLANYASVIKLSTDNGAHSSWIEHTNSSLLIQHNTKLVLFSSILALPNFLEAKYLYTNSLGEVVAGSAINVSGGSAGQVVYQTGPDTSSTTATGAANSLLQSNGTSAPTWTTTPSLKTATFTNTSSPANVAVTINHSGIYEGLQINTTSNVCGLRVNIPSGQSFNSIWHQPSTAQYNHMFFWQNNGAKVSKVGQQPTTSNLLLYSDSGIELASPNISGAGSLRVSASGVVSSVSTAPTITTYSTPGSGTHTVATNAKYMEIWVTGGGGGGGGAGAFTGNGGGGGGTAYAYLSSIGVASFTYTVGSGGTAGAGDGGDGGDSSLVNIGANIYIYAPGGFGGDAVASTGGEGGTSFTFTGVTKSVGMNGGDGFYTQGAASQGGSSFFSGATRGIGKKGSGGGGGTSAGNGQAGGDGFILIKEYF